jgi:hypothetical protein
VLLYEKDQGYPNFDVEQARAYLPKVAAAVGDFALSVLDQWKQIER